MTSSVLALAVLTIFFGFVFGGGKKDPKIPAGFNIDSKGGAQGESAGNSIPSDKNGDSIIDSPTSFSSSSSSNNSSTKETRVPTFSPPLATDPPETIVARKIPQVLWNQETTAKIIEVKDPEFFSALLEPRSNAFLGFRWDKLDVGYMVDGNATNATFSDNTTRVALDPKDKRNVDTGSPTMTTTSSTNLGIYLVTGVLVVVCVVGLLVIFCVARANGQRARDYEFGNRQRQRQGGGGGGTPAAGGWRRSQDYLNEAGVRGGIEERNADGQPAIAMTRMASDVTDV